jgi:hypothetical protein
LNRAEFVHGLVSVGDLFEGEGEVEDFAGVDVGTGDAPDEVGQEVAHGGGGSAVQVHVAVEGLLAGQ